jgi:hypothetical protein
MKNIALTLVGAAAFVAAGCGSERSMMTDPTGPGGAPVASPTFMSVTPGGGAMGVPVGIPLEFHWGTAMGAGMEQFVDLGTQYSVHVGGGMVDANGQVIDMGMYGPGFGGQWIQGGMMGTGHAGMAWGMMGGNWRHSNGAYGMAFTFTTA